MCEQIKSPGNSEQNTDKNLSVCERCQAKFKPKFDRQKLCVNCWKGSFSKENKEEMMLRMNALNNAHKYLELELYISDEIKVSKERVRELVKTFEKYLKTGEL